MKNSSQAQASLQHMITFLKDNTHTHTPAVFCWSHWTWSWPSPGSGWRFRPPEYCPPRTEVSPGSYPRSPSAASCWQRTAGSERSSPPQVLAWEWHIIWIQLSKLFTKLLLSYFREGMTATMHSLFQWYVLRKLNLCCCRIERNEWAWSKIFCVWQNVHVCVCVCKQETINYCFFLSVQYTTWLQHI